MPGFDRVFIFISAMSTVPSHPPKTVALVAPDNAGLDALQPAGETLDAFGIPWKSVLFLPCGAFPKLDRTVRIVIAASGDAQLPAALAEGTGLPVIRVPVPEAGREGLPLVFDETGSLPAGRDDKETFATMAIGTAGAKNAALFAIATLALTDPDVRRQWHAFRARQTDAVLQSPAPTLET